MCELIQHDIWISKPKLFQSAQILSHAKAHEIVVLCLLYIYLIFVDKFILSVVDVFVAVIFLVVVAIWRDDCVSYIYENWRNLINYLFLESVLNH